ncbi:hypothetical protein BO83DRAFT_402437 [Aspergillus eucalypticola CBS 122712]|uniref:Uncharacterized protein n=1 Tax=Aspergillus eucalypticola (strain CBS 122712 / IBT 29274) TaxID=1448314 RepID=A0A317UQN6_ASPEC|nr:uncharacterized protein BO83DRAFT_402437 [Aspergillus eucalypticola CBS 122712]PWY64313.1 hypothetical protein BO83DRAFT_402437 [Aspergillus eucalypticola CBS 122712]
MLSILKRIYRLPELQPTQTDSLKRALETLEFSKVAHGLDVLYCELLLLKLQNRMPSPEIIQECYFNQLLGDMDASTDVPTVWFTSELLQVYPSAKVILNCRYNIHAWEKSFRESVLVIIQSDFEKNAEKSYQDHYKGLKAPLCSFLDLPVPDAEFLRGNIASEFISKLMTVDEGQI